MFYIVVLLLLILSFSYNLKLYLMKLDYKKEFEDEILKNKKKCFTV